MNIAYIINHSNTVFFFAVTKKLEKHGINVYWISPGNFEWINWLKERGVPSSRILNLAQATIDAKKKDRLSSEEIAELEQLTANSTFSISTIILSDRILSDRPKDFCYKYLWFVNKYTKEFFKENSIKICFGEGTFALELIIHFMVKSLGLAYLIPTWTRIPDQRFFFQTDHRSKNILSIREPNESDKEEAKQYIETYEKDQEKPKYYFINKAKPWFPENILKRIMRNFNLYFRLGDLDQTRPLFFLIDMKRLKKIINAQLITRMNIFQKPPKKKPFILFALQVQPETAIDVYSPYYADQFWVIQLISRAMSTTHDLYVKEHSNFIGARGLKFFKQVKSLPNTVLIDPYINSHELIKEADLVITISGTIAYEAALLKKSTIVFCDIFFSKLPRILRCDSPESLKTLIKEGIELNGQEYTKEEEKARLDFMANVFAKSFKGYYIDPVSHPDGMNDDNISDVAKGVYSAISKFEK